MKKIYLFFFFSLFTVLGAYAQIEEMRNKLDDAIMEINDEGIVLRFIDATNGYPISKGNILIDDEKYTTDFDGKVILPKMSDGKYGVTFSRKGFMSLETSVRIDAGTILNNKIPISPSLYGKSLRIVLVWNKKPRDLDLHLEAIGEEHIFSRGVHRSRDKNIEINHYDSNGYGPETITIKQMSDNMNCSVWVYDYSNKKKKKSNDLSESMATIYVYGQNQLMHTFNIPKHQVGTRWNVFDITSGQITPINAITTDNNKYKK